MAEAKKTRLLIIASFFPPIKSVASQRIWSFVKYLPHHQYDIRVITAAGPADSEKPSAEGLNYEVAYTGNTQLIRLASFDKPTGYVVHKMKALYNKIILLAGIDPYRGWQKAVVRKADSWLTEWKADVILASFPIANAIEAGLSISEKHHVPLLVDLRDGITSNSELSRRERNKLASLERRTAASARLVISVSRPIIDHFRLHHPHYAGRLAEIRNGYDFLTQPGKPHNGVFTIAYAGKFYGSRRPDNFFQAVEHLLKSKQIPTLHLELIGVPINYSLPELLIPLTTTIPYLAYQETISKLRGADALLLILGQSDYKGVFSGKLFDYLGVMRPIVAIVDPDDVAADLIRKCNAGFVAKSSDTIDVAAALLDCYNQWLSGETSTIDEALVKKHHRSEQAMRLHTVIQTTIAHDQ